MRTLFIFLLLVASCKNNNSNTEVVETFANGKPKKEIAHFEKDSTREIYYYENGSLKEIKNFRNGKESGERIHYREDGTKAAVMVF